MPAAFPAVKLGALLIKQISKPLANFVKNRAKNNVFFRTYICMPPAQIYHWCDVRMKMYLSNIIRNKNSEPIPKLNEQAAIELGANLLGEFLILSIATSILLWEYNRQNKKEYQKEADEQAFVNNLEHRITELAFANEELDTKLRELQRLIYASPAIMSSIKDQPASNVGSITKAVEDAKIKIRSQ